MKPFHTLFGTLSRACISILLLSCAPAPVLAQAATAPAGKYECSYLSEPRPGLNFTLLNGGQYVDNIGKKGSVVVSGAQITFNDAGLRGLSAIYKGGSPPTFNFMRGQSELEGLRCQFVSH